MKITKKLKYQRVCPKCGSTRLRSIYLASPKELVVPGAKKAKERMKHNPIKVSLIGWNPANP